MSDLVGVNSPVRLLREKWDSPEALAQEMYAMLTAKGPPVVSETHTIKLAEPKGITRTNNVIEGDTFVAGSKRSATNNSVATTPFTPGRRTPPNPLDALGSAIIAADLSRSFTPKPLGVSVGVKPALLPTPADQTANSATVIELTPISAAYPDSSIIAAGTPVQFGRLAVTPGNVTQREDATAATAPVALAPKADPILYPPTGVIMDGQGFTYTVALYPNGPTGNTSGQVTVTFPQLSDDEVLDPGTIIWDVRKYNGLWYGYVPVWM